MKIAVKIESLMPDRTNYKQYFTKYAPDELYVEVEVPDEEVTVLPVEQNKVGWIPRVLTERGLQILIGKLADIADDVEIEHLHSQARKL